MNKALETITSDISNLPIAAGDILQNVVVVRKLLRNANNPYGNNNGVLCQLPIRYNGRSMFGACTGIDLVGMDFAERQQRYDELRIGDCLYPAYVSNARITDGKVFITLTERYPMEEKALQTFRTGVQVSGTVIDRSHNGLLWLKFTHPRLVGSWKGSMHFNDMLRQSL